MSYTPIQPDGFRDTENPLNYREFLASVELKDYVHRFWTLSTRKSRSLQSAHYRVIPDGCFDLLINCQSDETLLAATTANTYSIIDFNETIDYFGIRFLPSSIHYFFPFQLSEFVNSIVPGKELFDKDVAELEDQILKAEDVFERIRNVENYLTKRLDEPINPPDKRFINALNIILRSGGNSLIENEVSEYISSRHLRRMFSRYIGFSPKVFSRIVRFQTNLNFMLSQDEKKYIDPNSNYYDQSHFINEFKKFYGLTPSDIINK